MKNKIQKSFQKNAVFLQKKLENHGSNTLMYAAYCLAFIACSTKIEASMITSIGTQSRAAVDIVDGPLGYVVALLGTGIGLWGAIQKGSLMMAGVVLLIVCAVVYNVDMLKTTFMANGVAVAE